MTAIPEEFRTACLDAHDMILQQQEEIAHSASINLKYRLMLSCVLPIAEKYAITAAEKRTLAYIRCALGERPLPGKPELVVDNSNEGITR